MFFQNEMLRLSVVITFHGYRKRSEFGVFARRRRKNSILGGSIEKMGIWGSTEKIGILRSTEKNLACKLT